MELCIYIGALRGKVKPAILKLIEKIKHTWQKSKFFCTLALKRRSCLYYRHQPQHFPVTDNGYAAVVVADKFFAWLNGSNIFITRRHKAICP
jgi:hypothetical protein